MALAKATMVFEQGPYGWTESYYRNLPSATLTAEMTLLKLLAEKRIKLSGAQTKLSYLKVSNESIKRDTLIYSYGVETGMLPTGTSTENSDSRFAALIVKRANVNNTAVSNLLLRGIWDRLVTAEGFLALDPAWVPVWNAFLAVYIGLVPGAGNGWGFGAKDPNTSVIRFVGGVTQTASGHIRVALTNALPGPPVAGTKKRVFISGVQGAATINGQQIVRVIDDTTIESVSRIPMLAYLGGGQVLWNVNEFYEITQCQPIRTTERKTGRPLYLSRGRGRVRQLV